MTGNITNVQMTISLNLCDMAVSDLILKRGCLPIAFVLATANIVVVIHTVKISTVTSAATLFLCDDSNNDDTRALVQHH